MPAYCEILPPPRLRELVECFWISEQNGANPGVQRVLPDGCADLIYSQGAGRGTLSFVGPMTRFVDHEQQAGERLTGVRFRPAAWGSLFRTRAEEVRDRIVPLDRLCGREAGMLKQRLENEEGVYGSIRILEGWLPEMSVGSPVQKAVEALESSRGALSLDEAAKRAGLSARHFRRLCLETTGYSPKLLARILRFRRALTLAPLMPRRYADLAADCGYTDQSHLIADFRYFSGRTPRTAAPAQPDECDGG